MGVAPGVSGRRKCGSTRPRGPETPPLPGSCCTRGPARPRLPCVRLQPLPSNFRGVQASLKKGFLLFRTLGKAAGREAWGVETSLERPRPPALCHPPASSVLSPRRAPTSSKVCAVVPDPVPPLSFLVLPQVPCSPCCLMLHFFQEALPDQPLLPTSHCAQLWVQMKMQFSEHLSKSYCALESPRRSGWRPQRAQPASVAEGVRSPASERSAMPGVSHTCVVRRVAPCAC